MAMTKLKLGKVFQFIEPGPVVLLTTADKGKYNVMTLSWHTCLEFVPPLIGCCVGEWDHSFKSLSKTKECVLAVPAVDLAAKVVDIGNCSGRDTDKFKEFGLTALSAKKVKAPLIAECPANFECRVENTALVNKYSFFVLKVVNAWIDRDRKEQRRIHANGDGTFVVDGRTLDLKKRMVKWPEFL